MKVGVMTGRTAGSAGPKRWDGAGTMPGGSVSQAQPSAAKGERKIGAEAGAGADFPEHWGPEQGLGSGGRFGLIRPISGSMA